MNKQIIKPEFLSFFVAILMLFAVTSCSFVDDKMDIFEDRSGLYHDELDEKYPELENSEAVFLLIDEESIDNGNEPNVFKDWEINNDISKVGLREVLPYFKKKENIGKQIALYTGQVGDEGWFAPTYIPNSWVNSGPSDNGTFNYLFAPGYGLGHEGNESYLDKVPGVIPLRSTGLAMLMGQTIYAVVYDGDISVNYDPLNANLQGRNMGVVTLTVLDVVERKNGSSSSLPTVIVRIEDAAKVFTYPIVLFSNAPAPHSSSEPMDIIPPKDIASPKLVDAW